MCQTTSSLEMGEKQAIISVSRWAKTLYLLMSEFLLVPEEKDKCLPSTWSKRKCQDWVDPLAVSRQWHITLTLGFTCLVIWKLMLLNSLSPCLQNWLFLISFGALILLDNVADFPLSLLSVTALPRRKTKFWAWCMLKNSLSTSWCEPEVC